MYVDGKDGFIKKMEKQALEWQQSQHLEEFKRLEQQSGQF
jgi:hypothetical protein